MVAQRIEHFRKAKGVSRAKMATDIGKTFTCIYNWERGIRTPSFKDLAMLASYFEVPRGIFLSEEFDDPDEGAADSEADDKADEVLG